MQRRTNAAGQPLQCLLFLQAAETATPEHADQARALLLFRDGVFQEGGSLESTDPA